MRAIIFFFTLLVVLVAIAAGFAPMYFSTPSGNEMLARIINSQISGEVSFDRAKLSWTGQQSIRNLTLRDHNREVILTLEYAETETTLFLLLTGGKLSESMMRKLNVHLIEQPDGTSNLQQALESDIPPPLDPNIKPIVIDLENVNGMISMGTPNIPKKFHLVGITRQGDITGSFNIEVDSHSDEKHMLMEAQIKQLPVAIFDLFIAHKYPDLDNIATIAIGKTFDLELSNTYRNGTSFFKLDIESKGLQAELHGQMNQDSLTVTTPSEITLTVTPKLIKYFTDDTLIEKEAQAVFVLDQFKVPLQRKLTDLSIKFHLNQEKSDKSVIKYLDGTEVAIDTKEHSLPHLVLTNQDLQTDLLLDTAKRKLSGSIRINPDTQLQLMGQLTPNNELDLNIKGTAINMRAHVADTGNFQIQADMQDFPVTRVCHYVCFNRELREKVEAVLGNNVSGKINANVTRWSGNVTADVAGDYGEVFVDGYLQQGILKLRRPLTAKLQLTKQLGQEILEELFPLFSGVISGEEPVTLTISPEKFAFPLNPFHAGGVSIAEAKLDLNKVIFSNEGELGAVLNLLNPGNEDQLLVWFTPLYFTMQEGALQLERMDMLIMGEYPIATWGKVNFVKDKVNVIIGLSARAIEQAFNAENLPPTYMLQLSLKGPLNDAKIDRRKAAAKISSLIAKTQGIEGSLIGTVIDVASGNLSENQPPPPTTQPLPWDLGEAAPKSAPKQKRKKKLSYILDQVEKGASVLLPKRK